MDRARTDQSSRRFGSAREASRDFVQLVIRARALVHAYRGGLDRRLRERVLVAVSQVNACDACTQVHQRWALRSGVSPEELHALGIGDVAGFDLPSRAAVVYASQLAESRFRGPLADVVIQAAKDHLTVRQLEDVEAVARAIGFANLCVTTTKEARTKVVDWPKGFVVPPVILFERQDRNWDTRSRRSPIGTRLRLVRHVVGTAVGKSPQNPA